MPSAFGILDPKEECQDMAAPSAFPFALSERLLFRHRGRRLAGIRGHARRAPEHEHDISLIIFDEKYINFCQAIANKAI
jgi:hypothetical protein